MDFILILFVSGMQKVGFIHLQELIILGTYMWVPSKLKEEILRIFWMDGDLLVSNNKVLTTPILIPDSFNLVDGDNTECRPVKWRRL